MNETSKTTHQLSIWWQQSTEGNTEAFSNIHKSLFNGLYYYALKLLGDEFQANDALQELFIKLWEKKTSIGALKNVKAYFYVSLRRQILNQIRNLKVRGKEEKISEDFDIEFSPEEIVIKNQENQRLHKRLVQSLNELPRRQKEAIHLHYFEELSYEQIAEVMGINYQSVLNLIQRAIQNLRSQNLLLSFILSSLFAASQLIVFFLQ